ncbi:MAG: hypothetical protein ACRDJN_30335 [Chloroflexota bacterium]
MRRALAEFAPVPALQPAAIGGPGDEGPVASSKEQGEEAGAAHSELGTLNSGLPAQPAQPVLVEGPPAVPAAPAPERTAAERGRAATGGLRALGQIGLTYVVAEDGSGLYLIDQHSAHERVLYEQLLRLARDGAGEAPPAQLLLTPETVELNGTQAAWLREHAATLEGFGFQLEPFGGHTWLLRAVPRTMAAKGRAQALGELIDGLLEREYGDGPLDDQARWAIACHSAVRSGDALAPEEMAALITQLEGCDMRRTCPHGRPTMIHLSHAQLEREFGRR